MALFTIEQIELIRRLRSSGVTKDQVLEAFTELERLDAEFSRCVPYDDQLRNHNLEYSYDSVSSGVPSNSSSNGLVNSGLPTSVSSMNDDCLQIPFKQNNYFGPPSINHCSNTNSSEEISEPVLNGDCSINTPEMPSDLENEVNGLPPLLEMVPHVSGSESVSQTMYNNSSFSCSFFPLDVQSEELAELQELKKKGDMAVLAEIRNFVIAYNIKQTLIAEMTKMSQPYVSRFFRGDIQDMPERTKNVFFMWYLTCKNNPLKLAQMCPNSGVKRMVSESGDLIPLKRERFTFKGSHLAVLERFYEQDPYPDTQVRELIVEQCNKAAEKSEWPLSDRDTVTLPVVNNWFNNRRKDAKKQMRLKHGSSPASVQSPCQTSLSSVLPMGGWSPRSASTSLSYNVYQDLSSEITESDSSSTSERMDSDHNLVIDLQEQESCDAKQIL